jgi:prevent-host-death family protein
MSKIGVRELRQNASAYLARVEEGETFEVTVRGRPVAKLVPMGESWWDRLVEQGHVRPPSGRANLEDVEPVDLPGGSLAATLERMREDER